ncbi:hydroxyacid dehydrogenase [Plantactinospora sp. CA-294935]|uniref:hydroxyacid dehydrogenase n=1 Tax=Plantactinospora sp. CA-294935 TaxID=3240012 RepID=UPI003D90210D
MTDRLRVSMTMRPASLADHLFDVTLRHRVRAVADLHHVVLDELDSAAARDALATTDVLVAGWGAPRLTDEVLQAAPRLRAVLAATGSAGHMLGRAARGRGLLLTNARRANSRPVAEFATAAILLAGKRALPAARLYDRRRDLIDREAELTTAGNNGARVGIVGASSTGRLTIDLLRPFDLKVVVHDPYLSDAEARSLGVEVAGLDELMRTCPVVSVQAPELPETRGMIGAAQLAAMPDGATLINTARGSLVDSDALVAELRTGRIDAVLDVTDPEPLPPNHPLWDLPNVLLTPHVAGSIGNELLRLGERVVVELERLAAGLPPLDPEPLPATPEA